MKKTEDAHLVHERDEQNRCNVWARGTARGQCLHKVQRSQPRVDQLLLELNRARLLLLGGGQECCKLREV